jgi:undecaprenyl-diphosphatase
VTAGLADIKQRITAQEEPLPEQERRGRAFVRVYAALVALATLGFGVLVVFVRDQDAALRFDGPVAQAVQSIHAPVIRWVLIHMSDLGWSPYDVACVLLVAAALFALRLRLEALFMVVSVPLAGEIGRLAKDLVQRARPSAAFVHLAAHLTDYSFPSGHVIFATVLFGTTFWIVWIVWRSSPARNVVLVILAALVLLMGPSRVYLGEHWPTDVIGAYCLAGLWVAGTLELLLLLKPRVSRWWQGRPHRRRWQLLA